MIKYNLNTKLEKFLEHDLLTVKKNSKTFFLDPFELARNIKQISQLIWKIKKSQKNNLRITILVPHRFFTTAIQKFMIKARLRAPITIVHNVKDIKPRRILFICDDFTESNLDTTLKKLFDKKNIKVFSLVNAKNNKASSKNGCYPLMIDNQETRKYFYLVTLLNKLI